MRLLVLGGTADGRKLATDLHHQGIDVIYSVAGLVRLPQVNCAVVSGGFSQFGGLANYIIDNGVTAILDATHPYAKKMSDTAVNAATHVAIPCWRFHRPAWQAQSKDAWKCFDYWDELQEALASYRSVFLTCGQLTQAQVNGFTPFTTQTQLFRTAVQPNITLPTSMQWLKAIGPFAPEDEKVLMTRHKIDIIVSKNSGGNATNAKLQAARALGLPVYMLARPPLKPAHKEFSTYEACLDFVLSQ